MAQLISFTGKPRPFFSAAAYGFCTLFSTFSWGKSKKWFEYYFIIPFILNAGLFVLLIVLASQFFYPWIMSFLPAGDAWYLHALRAAATVFFAGLTALVMIMAYSVTGAIITAPFNDALSEKVERLQGAVLPERRGVHSIAIDGLRSIVSSFQLLAFVIVLQAAALLLNIIPVIGPLLYSVLSFWLWCFFLGMQSVDYSLERRRFSFHQKLQIAGRFRWLYFGFGAAVFVTAFIPVAGFMAMTLGAAGGARLWVSEIAPAYSLTVLTKVTKK